MVDYFEGATTPSSRTTINENSNVETSNASDTSHGSSSIALQLERPVELTLHKSDNLSNSSRTSQTERRQQWSGIKSLLKGSTSPFSSANTQFGWGPCYDIPTLPGRKGPTLGLHFDQYKAKDNPCIIVQTPDSMERYSLYGKLLQHTACAPYAITKVTFGHIVGMGRVIVCGSQCGKVIFYSLDRFEKLHVFDTSLYYPQDAFDSGDGIQQHPRDVTSLALVESFDHYCRWLFIGNSMGHVLHVQVPSFILINVISYPQMESNNNSVALDESREMLKFYHRAVDKGLKIAPTKDSIFVSCLKIQKAQNQLWLGYGDGSIGIFTLFTCTCLKFISNARRVNNSALSSARLDTLTSIDFFSRMDIAILVYGNDRIDILDTRDLQLLKSIPSSVFACSNSPIASIAVYEGFERQCNLFIGSMDGSLLLRKVERKNCAENASEISWTLLFDLAYNVKYGQSERQNSKLDDDDDVDFRGAPITCIYPLLQYNCVLVGNACGGLLGAWNVSCKLAK
ncbi:bifunctional WD40-repeat-containing domain superfamily/WD40-YVTN repeat-like-containing domain superfamily [Babesia duncani]|uniref:Bifunctional WD40-repeat-containing domain superfamily/WD40-YVTN repeat-like-containing domain superfamily n=1 Tax=Babesia duncani TaxID=323732 RepID=A0AAD9PN87_9APIC|nr:bifunctional WD40-repeat-containing domain superfamily/WD40-YVTN repeat-like-containing domain superfamily [Babesia duncani]